MAVELDYYLVPRTRRPSAPRVLNMFLQSQTFSTSWSFHNASVTSGVTAPDGTTTAFNLIEDNATAQHFISQDVVYPSASINYTLSFYVNSNQRSQVILQLQDNANGSYATVDIATVAILASGVWGTGFTVLNSGISTDSIATGSGGNGWYRCFLNVSSSTLNNLSSMIILSIGGNGTYAGNGVNGLKIWGAQLTPDSSLLVYTPTTTQVLFNPISPAGLVAYAEVPESRFNFEGSRAPFMPLPMSTGLSTGNIFSGGCPRIITWYYTR